jgi:imidazoleglycerol phosphate synthase glutamine amidotransferase subunit HisH
LLEIAPDCIIPGVGAATEAMAACAGQQLERLEHATK